MKVSVVICTWNRADLLDRALASLSAMEVPSGTDWEVVVVNNNSTDNTEAVIEKHQQTLPLKAYFEPRQGVANARNLASRVVTGDLLLGIDDDVEVDRGWFNAYVNAARRWPNAAYFGGIIEPRYERPPSDWITKNLDLLSGAILIRNLGEEERELTTSEIVYGANIAYRKSIFDERQFDSRLGPRGTEQIAGEETLLQSQLQAAGEKGVWVPGAKVRHYVPAHRATLAFVHEHYVSLGRMHARIHGTPQGKRIGSVPRTLWRQYLSAFLKAFLLRLVRNGKWLSVYCHAARLKGSIVEARLQASNVAD